MIPVFFTLFSPVTHHAILQAFIIFSVDLFSYYDDFVFMSLFVLALHVLC